MPHVYFKYKDKLFESYENLFGVNKETSIRMDVDNEGYVNFTNIIEKAN